VTDRGGSTKRRRRNYRWWQRLGRCAVAAGLLAVVLYAALPVWLPTGWVADFIASDLSARLGSAVSVGELSVSWSEGIRIASITVADPVGRPDTPLLTSGMVRADFSPLRLLVTRRIRWMHVDSPEARLRRDEAGEWNVESLRAPQPTVGIDEIVLRQGVVYVDGPEQARSLRIEIPDLQLRAGRRWPIVSLSGSAVIVHGAARALLGLSVTIPESPARNPRPVLKCTFRGLDLDQLDLIGRLGLPLARVEGVCEGSLSLPMADGTISKAAASLTVDRLIVEPTDGPALPMIRSAGIQLAGDVDLATQLVHVRSLQLRGPGVELSGQARFHTSLLEGLWLGGRMLSVAGTVNPRAVATVIRGVDRPILETYEVAGDVQVMIDYLRRGEQIESTVRLDASAASVSSAEGQIKPAGQTLRCSMSATCRPQTWQFVVDETEIQWGGNRLFGRGALSNIRRLLMDWPGPDHRWTLQDIGEDLALLDWYAEWRITDLDSLRRLGPIPRRVLTGASLDGRLTGAGRLEHAKGVRLQLDMACDDAAELTVGDWFAKSRGTPVAVSADLNYDEDSRRLSESVIRLVCGDGQASVRLTDAVFTAPGADRRGPVGGWTADVRGTAHVEQVEQLAACVGPAAEFGRNISGAASGEFAAVLGLDALTLSGALDATALRIRAADIVGKSPGDPVRLTWGLQWPWPHGAVTVDFDTVMPGADLDGQWLGREDGWSANARLDVSDAAWLAEQVPWLDRLDHPLKLQGAAAVRMSLTGEPDRLAIEADVSADELLIDWDDGARRKRAGVPLRASVKAALNPNSADPGRRLELADAIVRWGGGGLEADGYVVGADRIEDIEVDLNGEWTFMVNDAAMDLLPELVQWTDPVRLGGAARGRYHVRGTVEALQIDGHADGADLVAAMDVGDTTIVKPLKVPLSLRWTSTWSNKLTKVAVPDWTGRLGPIHAMGDARLVLPAGDAAAPELSAASHFRMWTSQPDQLASLLGELADRDPAGSARLEGQLAYGDGRLDVAYVAAGFEDLSFAHRGRTVTLDGDVIISEIAPASTTDGVVPVRVGRLRTDGLTVAAGQSVATLVADLRGFPESIRGSGTVLSSRLDVDDLRTWLAGKPDPPEQTDEYTARLIAAITEAVGTARRFAADADVTFGADIDLVSNFPDEKVHQLYDVRNVALRGRIDRGEVQVEYTGGVSGGTLIDRFETDLNEDEPELRHVSRSRDMMASPSLQPQVAAVFPGNEVQGSMWREMDLRRSLVDALANTVDPRHFAPPRGWSKTTFVEGITRGRAAPLYVTRLFPGLNLVEYPYERMVAFTDYYADGSAYNDMIFTGKTYNMYIEGTTDAEHVARYDVGLILGPTLNSAEWHHRYKQGRILLLHHKLKIVDGTKADEEVSFPWPNQTVFSIFVKNNYFYRLWLQRRAAEADKKK